MHLTEPGPIRCYLKRVLIQAALLVSTLFAGYAGAEPLQFTAEYDADFKGLPIRATGVRTLEKLQDNRFLLSASASNFLGTIEEQSLFMIRENGDIKPLEYQYHRSGLLGKRDAILSFDWERNRVLNDVQSTPWEMDIPEGALDKLLYQFKVRSDLQEVYRENKPWPVLSYHIADGGRIKNYRFRVLGEDATETPAGKFETIKVTSIRENDDRTIMFWLAPAHDFLLVRLHVRDEDDNGLQLVLKKVDVNDF